jgi:hypothetical protein
MKIEYIIILKVTMDSMNTDVLLEQLAAEIVKEALERAKAIVEYEELYKLPNLMLSNANKK